MIFGKFSLEIDPQYLRRLPDGMFIGHSVVVGKVFLGNFKKSYTAKSVNAEKYKSAYNSCGNVSHRRADDYARSAATTGHKVNTVVPQYVVIRARWVGNGWQYAEPKDTDITTNGDGVRLTARIIEQVADPFAW